jgi:hypothetical protein
VYWQYTPTCRTRPYRRVEDKLDEVREFLTSRRIKITPGRAGLPARHQALLYRSASQLTVYVYEDSEWDTVLREVDRASGYALTLSVFTSDRRAILGALDVLRNTAGMIYVPPPQVSWPMSAPVAAVPGASRFGRWCLMPCRAGSRRIVIARHRCRVCAALRERHYVADTEHERTGRALVPAVSALR